MIFYLSIMRGVFSFAFTFIFVFTFTFAFVFVVPYINKEITKERTDPDPIIATDDVIGDDS